MLETLRIPRFWPQGTLQRLAPGAGGVEPAVPSALACFWGPNHHQNCKCWAIFGGEASKKLGWLRFFWKTWIESCPILRLKKSNLSMQRAVPVQFNPCTGLSPVCGLFGFLQKWGCRWHQNPQKIIVLRKIAPHKMFVE